MVSASLLRLLITNAAFVVCVSCVENLSYGFILLAAEERNFSDEDDQSSKRCQNLWGRHTFLLLMKNIEKLIQHCSKNLEN